MQVAERIDDVPLLKGHIQSRLSELPGKLFFFNSVDLDNYRTASERNKTQVPGAAYLRKVESFIKDHYVGGELLMEFCRYACKESGGERCSWCSNNTWVGPETERIPHPVPDPDKSDNPGHFMNVFQTKSTGRKPYVHPPRKCLKDLYLI